MSPHGPTAGECLARTRSAVLNVLVAVGLGIAISGLLLRWRDHWAPVRAPEPLGRALFGGLLFLTVMSYAVRRVQGGRAALADPAHRAERFHRAHVVAAVLGALAVPLGLAYGWLVQPRLDAVVLFWVAALALGFLALPRALELEDFEHPMPSSDENPV